MLLVFAMKYGTKIPCPLPHNHFCCSLPSPVCLPHLLICTCLISLPIACPPSSVLCWCLLCFFYFCDMLHFFVTPFGLFVNIFSLSFFISTHSELCLVYDRLLIFDFSFDCVQIFFTEKNHICNVHLAKN